MREVVRRNRVVNGLVYLQVTRGVARARPCLSGAGHAPSLVVTAKRIDPARRDQAGRDGPQGDHRAGEPLGAGRHQDRPGCCPMCSPRRRPRRPAPRRPGSSTPTAPSRKARRPMPGSSPPTAGWSRARPSTASCAASPARRCSTCGQGLGLEIEERGFTVDEAKAAREAFITAATTVVMPVVADRWRSGRQRPSRLGGALAAAAPFSTLRKKLKPDSDLPSTVKLDCEARSTLCGRGRLCCLTSLD